MYELTDAEQAVRAAIKRAASTVPIRDAYECFVRTGPPLETQVQAELSLYRLNALGLLCHTGDRQTANGKMEWGHWAPISHSGDHNGPR